MATEINLAAMAENWPSAIVARDELHRFTGGLISPKTQANLDSIGEGPVDAIRIGRKVVYPVKSYIKWLESRATPRVIMDQGGRP
jgi:hypothetical protein